MTHRRTSFLVLAAEEDLPSTSKIWGTGGWEQPADRESLDWLTLALLNGWDVGVIRIGRDELTVGASSGARWIAIALDPDRIAMSVVNWLAEHLATERSLVIVRVPSEGDALARVAGAVKSEDLTGVRLQWLGSGPETHWTCRQPIEATRIRGSSDTVVLASLEDVPVVVARPVGRGHVVTIGFDPSAARDADGCVTSLLRHLLVFGSAEPVAWIDFAGTVVLRMDDPGGAQNVYSRSWYHPKMDDAEWETVADTLERHAARLSVAYISGWVDDGDAERGELFLNGSYASRFPGAVYPSSLVRYVDRRGHRPGTIHDYEAEARGIQNLRARNLGEIELHGYTHMHPDRASWSRAATKYEEKHWFRELGPGAQHILATLPADQHPLALGIDSIQQQFAVTPTTLISPGDQWTNAALGRALELGIELVDSYYLAIRYEDHFCWCQHVCSPYLSEVDARWFDSGLPVIGYFHDRDLVVNSVDWMAGALDQWRQAGAKRFVDFRELAGTLAIQVRLDATGRSPVLDIDQRRIIPLVRPVRIMINFPDMVVPDQLQVTRDEHLRLLPVEDLGGGRGLVMLPVEDSLKL